MSVSESKCYFFSPGSCIQEVKASLKEEPTESLQRPFNYDVVDVSKGFLTRVAYKKKVKSSKLDSLLERRVKQHVIEERERPPASATKPQDPKPVSSTSTPALSTPVRPRSPLKPHALTHTQLRLSEAVKTEEKSSTTQTPGPGEVGGQKIGGESQDELSKTTDKIVTPLPSPVTDPTPKDSSSTGTGENSDSPLNQTTSMPQKLEENERTTGPKETSSGQEAIKLPVVQETTTSSLDQQAACVASDATQAAHTENEGSEEPKLKLNTEVTFTSILGQKSSQDISPLKAMQQKTEVLDSVHSSTEANGMGLEDNQDNMQDIGDGRTVGESTPEPVSPLPQVNGNDDLGSENMSNSVVNSNNGVLNNRPQPKVNSIRKDEEQELAVSLKDTAQQKPLVNGDVAPLNDSAALRVKECLASKAEAEGKMTNSDQDYKPALKKTKLENNVDAPAAHTAAVHNSTASFPCVETKPSPGIKIIRMAPSPIPSAEESSLSDDFAEENGNSGSTEPAETVITQVTTTSTTSTTTVVSTQMRIATVPPRTPGEPAVPVVSTTESNVVSTLTTMTKTIVTKILPPGLDGQSEDSQSEMVTHEQKITADMSSETSVSSVSVSEEDSSATKGRVRLLKFSRTKKTRSDTALPSYCKFVTKSSRKSIFVLPHDDLKVLARRGGFREVPVFSYNAKPALDIWPYPSPRPTFGVTWR